MAPYQEQGLLNQTPVTWNQRQPGLMKRLSWGVIPPVHDPGCEAFPDDRQKRGLSMEKRKDCELPTLLPSFKHELRDLSEKQTSTQAALVFFSWSVICVCSTQGVIGPVLGQIAEDFNLPVENVASNSAIFAGVLSVPVALYLSISADRHGGGCDLFTYLLIFGGFACVVAAFSTSSTIFYISQFGLGCLAGSAPSIASSLLSDICDSRDKSKISAAVSFATGAGILLGQCVSTLASRFYNWRVTFVLIGVPILGSCIIGMKYIQCGRRVDQGRAVVGFPGRASISVPSLTSTVLGLRRIFSDVFVNWTSVLILLQGLPGSVPWGVVITYLSDYLQTAKGFTASQSTMLFAMFAVGGVGGSIGGAFVGQRVAEKSKRHLPQIMGISMAASIWPMYKVVNHDPVNASPVLVMMWVTTAGFLSSIGSSNVRAIILSVSSPSSRATSLSVANIINVVGRGVGPTFVSYVLDWTGADIAVALSASLGAWLVCAVMMFLCSFTISNDATKTKISAGSMPNVVQVV